MSLTQHGKLCVDTSSNNDSLQYPLHMTYNPIKLVLALPKAVEAYLHCLTSRNNMNKLFCLRSSEPGRAIAHLSRGERSEPGNCEKLAVVERVQPHSVSMCSLQNNIRIKLGHLFAGIQKTHFPMTTERKEHLFHRLYNSTGYKFHNRALPFACVLSSFTHSTFK